MLVRFSFKNFGSFRSETVFDMRAVHAYKEHEYNLIDVGTKDMYLKVAAIYGANASGKSNFVAAYSHFSAIVRTSMNPRSQSDRQEEPAGIHDFYLPFLLCASEDVDTEFDGVFIAFDDKSGDKYELQYGFSYNKDQISAEWLYAKRLSTQRRITIFERRLDKFSFGPSVKSVCDKYAKEIEKDVLALTFFSRLKLKKPYFRMALTCISDILPLSLCNSDMTDDFLGVGFKEYFNDEHTETLQELCDFVRAIDTGIVGFEVEKRKDGIDVHTVHIGQDGCKHTLPLNLESDGTKKAIALYTFIRLAINDGRGLLLDELNSGLHPLLVRYIVTLFHKGSKGGQLIYTTHDTALLDKRYFRRDQVWFVEKDQFGESHLYSLAEFKLRNDASFAKDYLSGAYGAIPIFTDFEVEHNGN